MSPADIAAARAARERLHDGAARIPREALVGLEFGKFLVVGLGDTARHVRVECVCGHVQHPKARDLLLGKLDRCTSCCWRYTSKHGRRPETDTWTDLHPHLAEHLQ